MALGFGFNKAKTLAAAEKFVQQGKLQNAISEYEKVVREDPKDLTVLNTIGDLYARVGQNEHAVHYFRKVGDQYAQDGFTVKAIAIYKKLTKLAPNNAEHTAKLAELYTQQGLFSDARAQYMLLADAHLRASEHNQAARIFQKILELEPDNSATQAKLAELYIKLGKKDEALKIYSNAAEALYARRSYPAASEALGKALTLDPRNSQALLLRGMIAADSGDSASAIRHLEQVPDLDSRPDALRGLLRAQLDSGSIEEAEQVAQKLLTRHNDSSGVKTVGEWNLSHNRAGNAVRGQESQADKLFSSGDTTRQETLHSRTADSSQSVEKLELQAHAHVQKAEYAQARDIYKKLSEMEPENALHAQNYRQMLAKLGEDSATRILSPEEAAQAFMVEELNEGSVVVQQKYDAPTENAIEAALTDAELFVSYNVPLKAIPPLEAALPLAPKDVTLNQRLASLYTRAERYGDAARICQNLSEIYRELGHPSEAARYQEAARKYTLRAGSMPAAAPPVRNPEPQPTAVPETVPEIIVSPATTPASAQDAAPSVQEFGFDIANHLVVEPEPPAIPVESVPSQSPVQEFSLQVSPAPIELQPEPVPAAATPEIDVSNEWEEMLSVEVEEPGTVTNPPVTEAAPMLEPVPQAQTALEPVPFSAAAEERQGGSDVCYMVDDKVQEIQFYISQKMWQPAKNALNALSEIAPDSPQIAELMAAISAGQSHPAPSPHASEPAAATLDETAATLLTTPVIEPELPAIPAPPAASATPTIPPPPKQPVTSEPALAQSLSASVPAPPFAAPRLPVPAVPVQQPFASEAATAQPIPVSPAMDPFAAPRPAKVPTANKQASASHAPTTRPQFTADEDSVLDLGDLMPATPAESFHKAPPLPKATVPSATTTEDILSEFVHNLESTELQDFLPKPHAQETVPAAVAVPVQAGPAAPSPSRSMQNNGSVQSDDAGSMLNEILSDLQEETAGAPEPEEDPETHYNLGIAFKEMGLLDEAIGELQKVCRAVDRGHGFAQSIQAYTWLAQCLVDKGAPEAAVRWYQKALQIPGLDDSSRCAIYYDLAAAYEAYGDNKSALANFMEVYGSNIDFRDVASRIKTLKS